MFNFLKKKKKPLSNQLFLLHIYDDQGTYVFDKPEWDTVAEAFVLGATEYLAKVTDNAKTFDLMFSVEPIPDGHEVELIESDLKFGSWYWSEEYDMELWLCPYLFNFYDKAPKVIYLKTQNENGKRSKITERSN